MVLITLLNPSSLVNDAQNENVKCIRVGCMLWDRDGGMLKTSVLAQQIFLYIYIFLNFWFRKQWENWINENKKNCRARAKRRGRWDDNHIIFFTWPKLKNTFADVMQANDCNIKLACLKDTSLDSSLVNTYSYTIFSWKIIIIQWQLCIFSGNKFALLMQQSICYHPACFHSPDAIKPFLPKWLVVFSMKWKKQLLCSS